MPVAPNLAAPLFTPSSRLPSWATAGAARLVDPALRAGAALAVVDAAVRAGAPYAGAWAERLGLAAAAAALVRAGRPEEETALRDALVFLQSIDAADSRAAGPAGPAAAAWRRLAAGPVDEAAAAGLLTALAGRAAAADLAAALSGAAAAPSPLDAVAAALRAGGRREGSAAALWAADVALNRWLGWPCGAPLVSLGMAGERRAALDAAGLAAALVRGAGRALDCFADLGRRAAALDAARRRLRARAAGRVLDRLLAHDCLRPAATVDLLSERAGRRLFDRLTALGAARELTGRPTFRLYGL